MNQINFNIEYNTTQKDYKFTYEKDMLKLIFEMTENEKSNLIIIPIFGESGSGKSTIKDYLLSYLQQRKYVHNPSKGANLYAQTRGIDGYLQKFQFQEIQYQVLLFDCEGFGRVDEGDVLTYNNKEKEEINCKKQNFLKKKVLELLKMSHFSIYVTDQSIIELDNIEFFREQDFQKYNKKVFLIYNKLFDEEIASKQSEIVSIKNMIKSALIIPQKAQKLRSKDFEPLKIAFENDLINTNISKQSYDQLLKFFQNTQNEIVKQQEYYLCQQKMNSDQIQSQQNQIQNQAIFEIFTQISEELGEDKLKYDPENLCLIYNELKSQDYFLTGFIGSGGQAPVFEARKGSNFVAVKCIHVDSKVKIDKEMEMIKKLQKYPFIHQYLDGFYSSDSRYYFQVTEKLQCDLKYILNRLEQGYKLPYSNILVSFIQMAQTIYALEVEGFSHFDIKPQNFLYDVKAGCLKLSDYGNLKSIQKGNSCTKNIGGYSLKYAAPEIGKQQDEYNQKTDIFSLGLVFLELTLGRNLILDEALYIRLDKLSLQKFLSNDIRFKELNRIIQQMLKLERKDRISPQQLVQELIMLKDEHLFSLKNLLHLELDKKFIEIIEDSYKNFSDSLKDIALSNINNIKKFDQLSGIIYINTLAQKTLSIQMEFYQTIQSIKTKIQDTEGIPPNDYQFCSYNNSQLADKEIMFHKNIKNETKLYMV